MLPRIFILLITILLFATTLVAAEPPITAAAFAPDGKSIVVGSQCGLTVYVWPELTEQRSLATRLVQVHDLAFSPDGQTLAAAGGQPAEEGRLELSDWPRSKLLHGESIGADLLYRVAWRADSEMLAVAGPYHSITLLDRSANIVHQVAGHSQSVMTVAFLPDGHFISASRDSTIRVWQPPTNELIRTLNNHTNEIHDIAVRPGSTEPPYVIASSSVDRTVRFWWPVRGRLMRFAKLPSPALDIEWTPDGTSLIAACADGHVRVIDPDSVQITHDVEVDTGWLYTLAVASDGNSAFVGGASGLMRAAKFR
jgi:WD40 repeat protein